MDTKTRKADHKAPSAAAPLQYQSGFGNHFVSEAVPGALPVGRNSPQRPPHGLYAELISGTSFTTPRGENRRTWTYRIQPSVVHRPYARIDNGLIRSAPFNDVDATPTQLRWSPIPIPKKPTDFIEGMVTMGGNGDVATQVGMCVHVYAANRSMTDRCFYNADGEMLIVPQLGRARFVTELGIVEATPGEIVVIPRGLRFRVELPDGPSRGYICENYGVALRLPELGPLGSNGLANVRDFLSAGRGLRGHQSAVHHDRQIPGQSLGGGHGSLAAQRRRLARQFRAVQIRSRPLHGDRHRELRSSRSVDLQRAHRAVRRAGHRNNRFRHLPAALAGRREHVPAAVVSPQRHDRVHGIAARRLRRQGRRFFARRRQPAQLHDRPRPRRRHLGARVSRAELKPHKIEDTMAFMFESRYAMRLTRYAIESSELQHDYFEGWQGLDKHFKT